MPETCPHNKTPSLCMICNKEFHIAGVFEDMKKNESPLQENIDKPIEEINETIKPVESIKPIKPKKIDYHFFLTEEEYTALKELSVKNGFRSVAPYLVWLIRQQIKA